MKHVLYFLVLSLGVSCTAFGKIKDPKVYDNMFNSCMAQKSAEFKASGSELYHPASPATGGNK